MIEQVKERPILFSGEMVRAILDGRKTQTRRVVKPQPPPLGGFVKNPYGQPGDRLWVRETWALDDKYYYRADGAVGDRCGKWKPSIHMPRAASRITLEITGVRVERLQEITISDIYAEGAITDEWLEWRDDVSGVGMPAGSRIENERDVWEKLWDSINGKTYPWKSNPWVWVIEFKRIKP